MSAAKDMWMEEVERACDDFANDQLTREQALSRLARLGISNGEAEIMLDEAVS